MTGLYIRELVVDSFPDPFERPHAHVHREKGEAKLTVRWEILEP